MTYSLQAQKRSGKDASSIRAQGFVPGVVYGPDREPASVSVKATELQKIYNEAGESTLLDFTLANNNSASSVEKTPSGNFMSLT